MQNEAIAREFAAYYDLFNKYRDDYRIDEILAGGDVAGIIERATEAEFDERLSLVGLLLDAVCGDMADIVAETDVLVALRDDLRGLKPAAEEGGDVRGLLDELERTRTSQLELGVAAGNLSKGRRATAEAELDGIAGLRQAVDGAAPEDAFALASQAFAARAAALQERAAGVEQRLRSGTRRRWWCSRRSSRRAPARRATSPSTAASPTSRTTRT